MTISHEGISDRHPEQIREYQRWFIALGALLVASRIRAVRRPAS